MKEGSLVSYLSKFAFPFSVMYTCIGLVLYMYILAYVI